MARTMAPPADRLPQVLPTDRLTASGMPVAELRRELRRIPDARNAWTVAAALGQTFGVIALAAAIGHPLAYVGAFVLGGRAFAMCAILAHEAAHRLLFSNRAVNDAIGRWLLAYPVFVPFDVYRRAHICHHKDELGPDEPDLALYRGYPIPRASMRRKLVRDAFFVSGWKNLRPLLVAVTRPSSRGVALRILAVQAVILAGFAAAGRPELYLLLWLAPWLTVWRVINRLRVIAEHGGMERSPDRRRTTHVVRQGPLARFWMVPYHTGYHLAHHADMGVPWRNLPRLHAELVASGWVPPELEHRSYLALWRALAAG